MKISFFEEFPSEKVLEKCDEIKFQFKLYLAEHSFDSFELYKKILEKNDYCKEVIWWPLLYKRDGYWFSGVANIAGVQKVFDSLKKKKTSIMFDFEFPFYRNLLWKNFLKRRKGKKLIKEFISDYKGEIYSCEYFSRGKFFRFLQKFFGIYINAEKFNNIKKIKMIYTSMKYYQRDFLMQEIKKDVEKYGDRLIIALGTIARGIRGDEPILTAEDLKEDLWLCKVCGVKEVIIYQLEGLTPEYLNVLEEYVY